MPLGMRKEWKTTPNSPQKPLKDPIFRARAVLRPPLSTTLYAEVSDVLYFYSPLLILCINARVKFLTFREKFSMLNKIMEKIMQTRVNFQKTTVCSLLIGFLHLSAIFAAPEVRYITPPRLNKKNIDTRILCHRPMRRGKPAMYVEKRGNKFIAHNYGHGGSGWTLGPGCAEYVTSLLLQKAGEKLTRDAPITIIGAGALGYFTALHLVEKGFTNIEIVAEEYTGLTSHNAGGLLAPVSMDNSSHFQKIIDIIGRDAYRFYKKIATGCHPSISRGAVIVPSYFRTREKSGLEPYVGVVMKPAKDVILDFGTGTKQSMVVYDDGIFIDTGEMMDSLRKLLVGKVRFVTRKIADFDDISTPFIFNCAGIGGQELVGDDRMVSVQGHLLMLKDQNPEDLKYMILIYLDSGVTASGQKVKRSFYIFPKQTPGAPAHDIGVIGGTFIEGADATTPNKEEFDIVIRQAKEFYGIK